MKTQQTFDELTGRLKDYLQQICRSDGTVHRYALIWARIKIFMSTRDMKFYNKQIGEAYLKHLFGATDYLNLKKYDRVVWNSVEALAEFQDTGTVLMGRRRKPCIVLEGRIGAVMEDSVQYKRTIHKICDPISEERP